MNSCTACYDDGMPCERCGCGAGVPWWVSTLAAVLLVVACALVGHLMSGCAAAMPAPCDVSTLRSVTALCQREVRAACPRSAAGAVSETCTVLVACDGGAGSAGAP